MTPARVNFASIALGLSLLAGCAHRSSMMDALPSLVTVPADEDASQPPLPGSYRIKALRPMKAGDTYDVRLITTTDITMMMGESSSSTPQVNHQKHESQISGRIDITSVVEHGQPANAKFTVETFTSRDGTTPLDPGKIIEFRRRGSKIDCTLSGGTLAKDAEKVLISFFEGFRGDVERMCDSTKARMPGETWDIVASDKSLPPEAESVSGEAKLTSVDTIGGVTAMHVEGAVVMKLKPQNSLGGLHLDQSKTTMSARAILPVDLTAPPLEMENGMDMEMAMSGSVLFHPVKVTVVTTRHMTRKPIAS